MAGPRELWRRLGQTLDRRLEDPAWLRLSLRLAWITFVLLAIGTVACCFSYLFLPASLHLPVSIWQFLMMVAALRLLTVGLGNLHDRAGLKALTPAAAERHFAWALRMTPGDPDIYCHWGRRLLGPNATTQDRLRARDLFERAHRLQPSDDLPYVELAYLELQQDNWQAASRSFDLAYRLRRGVAWNDLPERIPDESPAAPFVQPISTSVSKLNHDIQQLEFLLQGNYLPQRFKALQQAYQDLLRDTLGQGQLNSKGQNGAEIQLSADQQSKIHLYYGRNVFVSPVPAFPREVLNQELDFSASEAAYLQGEPRMVVIDQLLQPDACEALLHFCQKSTIWHDDQRPGGYLGAYIDDGFSCDLLYQIAQDLRDAMPGVFKGQPLKHMWAYKYDSRREGIGIHADGAAVNVNFWITPDSANLDPESGGLLIYPARAPEDWDFRDINHDTAKAESYVADLEPVRVPYAQNRAVIFDSRLFHATDSFHFSDQYLLRRINITLLYGS